MDTIKQRLGVIHRRTRAESQAQGYGGMPRKLLPPIEDCIILAENKVKIEESLETLKQPPFNSTALMFTLFGLGYEEEQIIENLKKATMLYYAENEHTFMSEVRRGLIALYYNLQLSKATKKKIREMKFKLPNLNKEGNFNQKHIFLKLIGQRLRRISTILNGGMLALLSIYSCDVLGTLSKKEFRYLHSCLKSEKGVFSYHIATGELHPSILKFADDFFTKKLARYNIKLSTLTLSASTTQQMHPLRQARLPQMYLPAQTSDYKNSAHACRESKPNIRKDELPKQPSGLKRLPDDDVSTELRMFESLANDSLPTTQPSNIFKQLANYGTSIMQLSIFKRLADNDASATQPNIFKRLACHDDDDDLPPAKKIKIE